jgi:hypothetical protein
MIEAMHSHRNFHFLMERRKILPLLISQVRWQLKKAVFLKNAYFEAKHSSAF